MTDHTYTRESVISAFDELGCIRKACDATGCPPYTAFAWLRKVRNITFGERQSYAARGQLLGARAELEFQKLVPDAMPANQVLQANCPGYDFDVGGVLVDAKASTIQASGRYTWRMCAGKSLRPDYVVVFLVTGDEFTDGYRVLLLPEPLFADRVMMSLTKKSRSMDDFEIQPEQLAAALYSDAGLEAA